MRMSLPRVLLLWWCLCFNTNLQAGENPWVEMIPTFPLSGGKNDSLVPYGYYSDNRNCIGNILNNCDVYRSFASGLLWGEPQLNKIHKIYNEGTFSTYDPLKTTCCWFYIVEGQPVGLIGFQPDFILNPPLPEIFFALKDSGQGKGLLKEGLERILPWFDRKTSRNVSLRFPLCLNYAASPSLLQTFGFLPCVTAQQEPFSICKGNITYKIYLRPHALIDR